MTLTKVKPLLDQAQKERYGVGAFNVSNMEMVIGTIRAAEALGVPIILQIAESRLEHSPLELIGPVMVAAAKKASVPVAVHLDHGKTLETVVRSLKLGFTSVMFDGSQYPIDENVARMKAVKEIADAYHADVEGEIGNIGGIGRNENEAGFFASVEGVQRFLNQVSVTSLAIGIGNYHGIYKGEPDLKFDLLKDIAASTSVPLVLHGGSGISKESFQKAIQYGICKINVATSTFVSVRDKVASYEKEIRKNDYFYLQDLEIEAAQENVRKHLEYFHTGKQMTEV